MLYYEFEWAILGTYTLAPLISLLVAVGYAPGCPQQDCLFKFELER